MQRWHKTMVLDVSAHPSIFWLYFFFYILIWVSKFQRLAIFIAFGIWFCFYLKFASSLVLNIIFNFLNNQDFPFLVKFSTLANLNPTCGLFWIIMSVCVYLRISHFLWDLQWCLGFSQTLIISTRSWISLSIPA